MIKGEIAYLDVGIICIYLILTFGFGLFANRLLKSNRREEEGFYLAGRKLPGWLNGISTAVTYMNADVAPVYFGVAVGVGLPVCWFYLGRFGLALLLGGMLFAARWRQLAVFTGPEFYSVRFGGRGGTFVRIWSSLFTVIFRMVPWLGAGILGVHLIFGPIVGLESKAATMAIVLPVLLIYVCISGFAGVLVTDVMQSLIIIGSSIILGIIVLYRFGGPGGLAESIANTHGMNSSEILASFPVAGHEVFSPSMVIAWLLILAIGVGGEVGLEGQRVLSCRNAKEAVKVSVWTQIALFMMLLSLTLPALGALVTFPELYGASTTEREAAYGRMLMEFLPPGVRGLMLAALGASVMSTIDSHLNYGAQTLLNDVYRPIKGRVSDRESIWLGRLFMVLILVLAIIVVYYSDNLIGIAVVVVGLYGSVATMAWAQWWWWRFNIWSWISGIVCGPIVYFQLDHVMELFPWWGQQLQLGESVALQLGMIKGVIAMGITTVIWITVTLITKPTSPEVLRAFYKRARPMGIWGPVRQQIQAEDPSAFTDEPRYLIPGGVLTSIIGAVSIASMVLSISEMYIGRYAKAGGFMLVALIVGLGFKKAFHWHMNRLE